jgi:hypothetical protein
MQKYKSADTSLNQVPALIKHLVKENILKDGMVVLDYGCGKYDTAKDYVLGTCKVQYLTYDPYNRSKEVNKVALSEKADIVILANVLNTIREPEARRQVLLRCQNQMKSGARLYVSTYKAPKSKLYQDNPHPGQPTKKGTCWQNCLPLSIYIDEVRRVLPNILHSKGTITAQN